MLVTLKEAAQEFKISPRHAKILVTTGKWPAFQLGPRVIRVNIEQIKQLTGINGPQSKCQKGSGKK